MLVHNITVIVALCLLGAFAFLGARRLLWRSGLIGRWQVAVYVRPVLTEPTWHQSSLAKTRTRYTRRGAEKLQSRWMRELLEAGHTRAFCTVLLWRDEAQSRWEEPPVAA